MIKTNSINIDYASFLDSMDWNVFGTLTTEYKLTPNSARRMVNKLNNLLSGTGQIKFWVSERYSNKEGCHLHLAIKVGDIVNEQDLMKKWCIVSAGKGCDKNGQYVCSNRAQFKQRNYALRAGAYLTKGIAKNINDYDFC